MNLTTFVAGIKDKPLDVMAREVDEAAYRAERDEKAFRRSDLQRAEEAREARRVLGGIGFFLHHTAKADGLTDTEFAALKPLAESLVERGTWKPEAINVFEPNPPAR